MKNNYVVRVLDLPEHERLILKLIFSVSGKSKLRSNVYTLAENPVGPADVEIRDARNAHVPSSGVSRALLVMDAAAAAVADTPVILRPLIATRVLAVLDDVCAAIPLASPRTAGLAIATDQSQEHPANREEPGIPASEGAVVAAMVDTLLLSTPIEGPRRDITWKSPHIEEGNPALSLKPRVLVVDDNAAVCKQLEIELLQFAVVVDYVPSARKAIEMIGKHPYKVVLLDVALPDWDGFKICKHIKSKAPGTTVVMLMDKLTTEDKLRGTLAGCDAYLVKPVGRQIFQATLKKYLPLVAGTRALGA